MGFILESLTEKEQQIALRDRSLLIEHGHESSIGMEKIGKNWTLT